MNIVQQKTSIPNHVNVASKIDKESSKYKWNLLHDLEMSIMSVDD